MSDQPPPDDPFAPRDGTVMRPRPGGGRRPESTAGGGAPPPRAPPARPMAAAGPAAAIEDFLAGARNPIVAAAAPLLTLASRLGTSVQQANVGTLRQQAVQ